MGLQPAEALQALQDEYQEQPPAAPVRRVEQRGIGQVEQDQGRQRHDGGSQPADDDTRPADAREERQRRDP